MSTPPPLGPEYPHTETVFKRDKATNVIIPSEWTLDEFGYLANNLWHFTEKVDGTNMRLHWHGAGWEPVLAGRTDKAQLPKPLVKHLEPWVHDDAVWRTTFGDDAFDVTLYGEGYGAGIQKGGNYGAEQRFILFDVRIRDWWLKREDVEAIAGSMGLDVVPSMGVHTLRSAVTWVANKAELGDKGSLKSHWPGVLIEGLIGEPLVPLRTRRGDRIRTKIKVRDWADYFRKQETAA